MSPESRARQSPTSRRMHINYIMKKNPPVVTVDTLGQPGHILSKHTDVGHAFRTTLDQLGFHYERNRLETRGRLLAISGSLKTAKKNLPEFRKQIVNIAKGNAESAKKLRLVLATPAEIEQDLLLAHDTLNEMERDTPLTQVIGAIAVPLANHTMQAGVWAEYDRKPYWRYTSGEQAAVIHRVSQAENMIPACILPVNL